MNRNNMINKETMNTWDIIGHIQHLDYENQRMREELEEAKANKVDAAKFYAVAVTVEVVAVLHRVHADTVRKYVNMGLIEKHNDSTDAKILIRASEALLLNFSDLRKKSRTIRHNK